MGRKESNGTNKNKDLKWKCKYKVMHIICSALKDSLGCVTKYNKNCDVSQLATIKTELSMAEAFIGSHTCDLEEWCNTDLDEEQDGEIIFKNMFRHALA